MDSQLIPEMIETKIDARKKYLNLFLGDGFITPELMTPEGQQRLGEIPEGMREYVCSINKLYLVSDFIGQVSDDFIFSLLKDDRYDEVSLCHLFDLLIFHSVLEGNGYAWPSITQKMNRKDNEGIRKVI